MRAPASSLRPIDGPLVVRAQSGDRSALTLLVRRNQKQVGGLLRRMLGAAGLDSLTEDLAQETFIRAFRALDRFDPDGPATFSTWLLRIASRLAINELARKRPQRGSTDSLGSPSTPRMGSHRAEQSSGTVTYRVRSGTPFVVRTPAADITVHGTEFTVEMLTMQDERRRKYLGAGALAMGGVAVAIYVAAGQVEVHTEHGRTELAPGEMAVASEHASPRSEPAPIVAAVMPVRAKRKTISPREREEVKRRLEDALAKRRAPVGESADADAAEESHAEEPTGSLGKDYIRDVVREDLVPIAKECYDNALEQRPDLAGSVIMKFSIVGDESVGGIVDEVSFAGGALFEDDGKAPPPAGTHVDTVPAGAKQRPRLPLAENPEFAECLSESAASLLFDPPEGGGRVQVTYPFVFTQADDAPAAE